MIINKKGDVMTKITKKTMIEDLRGFEFLFVDYGYCAIDKAGNGYHWGEICEVELPNGKYVKANLYKLPIVWTKACQYATYFDEWIGVEKEDVEYMNKIWGRALKDEMEGLL